jgi:small subunit ribosomal protein S7
MTSYLSYKHIIFSFIKILQKKGQKDLSEITLRHSLCLIKKNVRTKPFLVITKALKKIKPFCQIKSIKISGTNYRLPIEIKPEKQKSIALKWLLSTCFKNSSFLLSNNLHKEFINIINCSSKTIKFSDDFHKIAEANKIYINYRH